MHSSRVCVPQEAELSDIGIESVPRGGVGVSNAKALGRDSLFSKWASVPDHDQRREQRGPSGLPESKLTILIRITCLEPYQVRSRSKEPVCGVIETVCHINNSARGAIRR